MECSGPFLLSLLLLTVVVQCFATSNSCGNFEFSNTKGTCLRTCNACRDCGACLCKSGYIRATVGGDCILDEDCHKLHFKWVHDAKYSNRRDKFFNCEN